MHTPYIELPSGLSIDVSQLKCFKINLYGGPANVTVEYKTRYEYIYNPSTEEYEKHEYNDSTVVECPDYGTAKLFVEEWNEIWQRYLEGQL